MDQHLTMSSHVSKVCRSAMAAIRKIGHIRAYMGQKTTLTLVHAFVTSRLDACNVLLGNLPQKEVCKIQRIQNIAARIITRSRCHEHITPILRKLHWLPIHKRIQFKILLLTFKSLRGTAPSYIKDLIRPYIPTRALRSQQQNLLQVPRCNTQYHGHRSFSVIAPTLWNSLPHIIRDAPTVESFKSLPKTYLFQSP